MNGALETRADANGLPTAGSATISASLRIAGINRNFSQTMLRVKDPKKSVAFYQRLGMKLLKERHFDDFSLYFMASSSADESIEANNQFQPILELTHNHGTEDDKDFVHYNGNEEGRQGFGHVG